MLKCEHCGKEFKFKSEKKRHEMSHFTIHECEVCEKKFSFISSLRRHQKQHTRKGSVPCNKCSRNFKDETLLQRHIQYAHKGCFPCADCKTVFHSELALKAHSKCHRKDSEKKYVCSYFGCGKKFNYSHHLHHHKLAHTGAKQHYCNICEKGFIQLHHLKTHLKLHEPSENWFSCPVGECKKEFPTQYARKRHIKRHKIKQEERTLRDNAIWSPIVYDAGQINSDDVADEDLCDEIPGKELKTNITVEYNDITKHYMTDRVNACTSILGSCLVSGNNEVSKDCLCAQMDINENMTGDNTFRRHTEETNSEIKLYQTKIIENVCKSCECSENKILCDPKDAIANINILNQKDYKNNKDNMPKIKYGSDGTVKLEEIFDTDIEYKNVSDETGIFRDTNEPFLFNSCKAVLGKCIVSGNSMMGEGCLCARMAIDDQLIATQELEEITPCPNGVPMNHVP